MYIGFITLTGVTIIYYDVHILFWQTYQYVSLLFITHHHDKEADHKINNSASYQSKPASFDYNIVSY